MNNTTFQILKSVLDGNALKVAQANTAYEVLNAVYDSSNEALRVNIDNLEKNIGITLNDEYISGVKSLIELDDVLNIPENYQYNIVGNLTIDGEINGGGVVNLITDTFIDGFTLSGYELIIENNDGVDLSVDLEPIIDNLEKNCVYVTHSDLQLLVASSGLQVGKKYAIYDYVPAWNIFDGGTMAIIEEQTGIGEILIATAISTNEIDSSVVSVTYPQDIIHYSLDLIDGRDIGFGNGAGTPVAHFKGMIYYRKDTIQNVETHYDFRNVKFRRWAVDAVAFDNGTAYVAKDVCKASNGKIYKCITATTGEGDPTVNTADWILWLDITADAFVSWTSDKTKFNIGRITTTNLIINNVTAGVDYDDFYTFGDWYNWVKNVSIGMIDLEYAIGDYSYATQLNNVVFKTIDDYHTCFGNNIGSNCWNNTIGNYFYSNTIGNDFNSNTIGNDFIYNAIGNSFMTNTIGNYFSYNTIGNNFYSNTTGYNFNSNTIGDGFYSNTIGDEFNSNTIGNVFSSNAIGDEFHSNTIGIAFYSNAIGLAFYSNVIGNNFFSNTIGNDFYSNAIGNYFYKTNFGNNCQYNTIANKINGTTTNKIITFGDSITMCTIQDYAFGVLAADLDLSLATHIRGAYNTTIYKDRTGGVKLSYMDGGVPQYVDVTA